MARKRVEYTFRDNKKIGSDGSEATLTHLKENIASNGYSRYILSGWSDGMLTCDCRGWCMAKKVGNPKQRRENPDLRDGDEIDRTCKHCKEEENSNRAGMQQIADYQPTQHVRPAQLAFAPAIGQRRMRRVDV